MQELTHFTQDMLESEDNINDIHEKMREDNDKRFMKNMILVLVEQTGVEKIRSAFGSTHNKHEESIDIIMRYILKTTDFSNDRISPSLFFMRELGFKQSFLSSCGADNEKFYQHSTLEESCENLITRALKKFGYEVSMQVDSNGYPLEFSFQKNVNKFIERNQVMMYPFYTSRYYNNDKMMDKIYSLLNEGESRENIYFHGTSWENSRYMMDEILLSRRFTDFGRNCFYVSNYLQTEVEWSIIRNDQPCVIVFKMDDNWINNIQERLKKDFDHNDNDSLQEWREFVFRSRSRVDNNYTYVNGPILANSRTLNYPDECIVLRTGNVVPYQSAVKTRELCEEFRTHILCIIFFRAETTLEDNGIY